MFPFSSEMDVRQDYDGCSHYKRKCKLVAPCCGGVFNCRCVQMKIVNSSALSKIDLSLKYFVLLKLVSFLELSFMSSMLPVPSKV